MHQILHGTKCFSLSTASAEVARLCSCARAEAHNMGTFPPSRTVGLVDVHSHLNHKEVETMTANPLSARNGLFSMITHPVIYFSPLVSR
jgi:hypothetical protein